jgi:hypothetical protein
VGHLWDSGRVESADSLLVPWDGPALRPETRYHWRVDVWDENGEPAGAQVFAPTAYSEPLLRPTPGGGLTWARAEQETARGRVACGWSVQGDRLTVTASVPPGSTAVLEIPGSGERHRLTCGHHTFETDAETRP